MWFNDNSSILTEKNLILLPNDIRIKDQHVQAFLLEMKGFTSKFFRL